MEIRKEIESLAIWYIPAFIFVSIMGALFSGYLKDMMEYGAATPGSTFAFLSAIGSFINLIDNLVVGVWLYLRGKKDGGRVILWFFFGVVANFYAALMYIGLKIYEQQKAPSIKFKPRQ